MSIMEELEDGKKQIFKSVNGILYDSNDTMDEQQYTTWQLMGNEMSLANFISRKETTKNLDDSIQHLKNVSKWNNNKYGLKNPSKTIKMIDNEKHNDASGCLRDDNNILQCENQMHNLPDMHYAPSPWDVTASQKIDRGNYHTSQLYKQTILDHR